MNSMTRYAIHGASARVKQFITLGTRGALGSLTVIPKIYCCVSRSSFRELQGPYLIKYDL